MTMRYVFILVVALLVAGCGGSAGRYNRALESGTTESWQHFIASDPEEPYMSLGRAALADAELKKLGPKPPIPALELLAKQYADTSTAPKINYALAMAQWSESENRAKNRMPELTGRFRGWLVKWEKVVPEAVPEVRLRVVDLFLGSMEESSLRADTLAARLGALSEVWIGLGDQSDRFARLLATRSSWPSNAGLMVSALRMEWRGFSDAERAAWMQAVLQRAQETARSDWPVETLRELAVAGESALPPDQWENLRARYDESLVRQLSSNPNRQNLKRYLDDPYARQMRDEWAALLSSLEAAKSAAPDFKQGQAAMLVPIPTEPKRPIAQRVRDALGTTDPYKIDPKPAKRSPISPIIVGRALLSISLPGRSVIAAPLVDSGWWIGYDANASDDLLNSLVTGKSQRRGDVSLRCIAIDVDRKIVLFEETGRPASLDTLSVRFASVALVRPGDVVTLVTLRGGDFEPQVFPGQAVIRGNSLPGSSGGHTLTIKLEGDSFPPDVGIIVDAEGSAIALLSPDRLGAGEVLALGAAEAEHVVGKMLDERLHQEASGSSLMVEPDAP